MPTRMYLFALRRSARVAMAQYVERDHPSNEAAWGNRWPFNVGPRQRESYNGWREFRREMRDLLAMSGSSQLGRSSWSWCDISGWGRSAATQEEKLASIPQDMRDFLGRSDASTDVVPMIQWANPMDIPLAQAWLQRACRGIRNPNNLATLTPREQHTAVLDMWAAFANYWKALNISPQGWAKYRDAWEVNARPQRSIALVLKGVFGYFPRPCAAMIASPVEKFTEVGGDLSAIELAQTDLSTLNPTEDQILEPGYLSGFQPMPDHWQRIGPWRAEAMMMSRAFASSPIDLNLDGANAVVFGNIGTPQPPGPGAYGEPASHRAPTGPWARQPCQEGVINGAGCYGPMSEGYSLWMNNDAMLTGGMNPTLSGVYEPVVGWNHAWQCLTSGVNLSTGATVIDPAIQPPRPVLHDWLTAYATVIGDGDETLSIYWQAPLKRYYDMLVPLLEYLQTVSAQEIAVEVMGDVLGKNTFSMNAGGFARVEDVENSILSAIGQDRSYQLSQRRSGEGVTRLITTIAQTTIGVAVGIVGTPAASALVAAGFGVLNGAIDAATPDLAISNFTAGTQVDVFGRPDSVKKGLKWVGNIERYQILPIEDPWQLSGFTGTMRGSIRVRSRNNNGDVPQPDGFVVGLDHPPWPVGNEGPDDPVPGRTITLDLSILSASVGIVLNMPRPERVEVQTDATGASPVATVAAGAVAGAALGLVVAAAREKKPRTNPSTSRRMARKRSR